MSHGSPPLDILLVEDSPSDAMLCRAALAQAGVACRVHHVEHGVDALDYLHRRGAHAGAPRPDLVLLDLNLPMLDGRKVLEAIKGDPGLRAIPVVVLTTSRAREDVDRAYQHHANCYVVKPLDFDHFTEVMREIERFWFRTALLPAAAEGRHA